MAAQRTSWYIPLGQIIATVGTWALTIASNIATLNKTAADNTSVMYIPVIPDPEMPGARARDIKSVEVEYSVATASLDAAPTYVLSRVTMDETTGVRSRATVAQAAVVRGSDTTGLAAGTYVAKVTPTSPVRCENNEELWLEMTIDAAATSVVKIGAVRVNVN